MKSTITHILLLKRYVYPFPVAQILNPYHAECVCVGGGGGGGKGAILWVFCNAIFFEFRAKHQIIFFLNKQNWEEYFHRQHI